MNKPANDILKELQELAPSMVKRRGENPFRVPEGYFEALQATVQNRIKQTQPEAAVPEGYFENFPSKVMERIRQEEMHAQVERPASVIKFTGRTKILAVAALLTGAIIVLTFFLFQPNENTQPLATIDEVPTIELETYIEQNIQDIEEENLRMLMAEEEMPALDEESVATEELEKYLEEDIDLTTLEEML